MNVKEKNRCHINMKIYDFNVFNLLLILLLIKFVYIMV